MKKKFSLIILFLILITTISSCSLPTFNELTNSNSISFDVFNELNENVSKAHVRITLEETHFYGNESLSLGSGVIVSEDDSYYYMLTNNHVVYTTLKNVVYKIIDCYLNEYTATLIYNNANYDLAYLKFAKKSKYTLTVLEIEKNVNNDDIVIALGEPEGQNRVYTIGRIISTIKFTPNEENTYKSNVTFNVFKHSAKLNSGCSGGALLNSNLKLIGINFASAVSEDTEEYLYSYAIPISKTIEFINLSSSK